MHWPVQLESMIADRQARIRQEMELVVLLRQLPKDTPHWKRWAARFLVHWGGQLTKWGARLAKSPCPAVMGSRMAVSLRHASVSNMRDSG